MIQRKDFVYGIELKPGPKPNLPLLNVACKCLQGERGRMEADPRPDARRPLRPRHRELPLLPHLYPGDPEHAAGGHDRQHQGGDPHNAR